MLQFLTRIASPGGARGRLLTFFFHRVLERPDPMQPGEPVAGSFDRMLGWIGEQFQVMPALEACERLYSGTLPPRAALITFDDGYRDNFEVAMPILLRHRMSALFFVASGYLEPMLPFNDRVREALRMVTESALDLTWMGIGVIPTESVESKLRALPILLERVKYLVPDERECTIERFEEQCGFQANSHLARDRPMLTPDQVVSMVRHGMEIGAHTHSHPILRLLSPVDAMKEMVRGREELGSLLGGAPLMFSYPNGKLGEDFDLIHRDMAKDSGFRYAFSTHRGVAVGSSDPYMLPRFMPWNDEEGRFKTQALRVTFGMARY